MKIEIGKDFPQYFKPSYPEEFELFSHFEVTAGIPTVLFAINLVKEGHFKTVRVGICTYPGRRSQGERSEV